MWSDEVAIVDDSEALTRTVKLVTDVEFHMARNFGSGKGPSRMADDFDEPSTEFADVRQRP